MDMQFGADGAFYLLTYGDGFFAINPDAGMYRWEYVKGQRAPKAVLTADKTDGPLPLTVQVLQRRLAATPIRATRSASSGTSATASPISTEPNPTHIYTKAGRYTAILTVIDSTGKTDVDERRSSRSGNTAPTVDGHSADRRRPVRLRRQRSRSRSRSPIRRTPSINCNDVTVTFVLGHDTHGHAEAEHDRLPGLPADRRRATSSHGGNVFGVISATYTDKGGRAPRGGSAADDDQPDPDPPEAPGGRVRRQPVRHDHGDQHRRRPAGAGVHRGSLAAGDWIQLNGPFNLFQIDIDHVPRRRRAPAGRTAGSPLAAIEIRQDSITGPIVATANLTSTGGTGDVWTTARRSRSRLTGQARAVPRVPRRSRAARRAATCSTSTGPSSAATA